MKSKRMRLRRFQMSDLPNMMELESDAEVMKFTSLRVPLTSEQTEQRLKTLIENEEANAPLGVWAAELVPPTNESADFVGWFMLLQRDPNFPAELCFMIVRRHWGKGLTAEAAACLVDLGLNQLKLSSIVAKTDPANIASKRVLEKLGFKFSKTISNPDKVFQRDVQLAVFELSK